MSKSSIAANLLLGLLTKKGLLTLLMVGGVTFSAGVGTYALFQDTDLSESNSVQAGTMDMSVDGANSANSKFSITSGQPGDTATYNYTLNNSGTTAANHLQVNASFGNNDPTTEPADTDLNTDLTAAQTAAQIEVTKLQYTDGTGSTDFIAGGSITDANGNGIVDLADAQNASALDDLNAPAASEANSTYLEITVKIADDDSGSVTFSDEDIMADGIDVTLHFTLMQEASQDQI